MTTLRVDLWSDFACPWCWVGKRHLEAAAAQGSHQLEVHWHAFELDPRAPKSIDSDVDYVQRLADKYGATRERAQQMIDSMVDVGRARGLEFRFDRARPTNTFDAHRLMHAATDLAQTNALGERLFRGYMNEGEHLGDHETLVRLAERCGIQPETTRDLLTRGRYAREVREDEATAAELGVTGVPFFVFERLYAVPGAQPPEVLLEVMQRALADVTSASDEEPKGIDTANGTRTDAEDICGPDGCATTSES